MNKKSKSVHIFVFLFLTLFSFKEASPIPNTQYPIDEILSPSPIKYEHPRDQENFKNGFEDGSLDAGEGVFSLCAAKKCTARNPYERGYKLGYKKGARQNKFQKKGLIDPLIDSPGKTRGSDFNGDGIHDILVGAYWAEGGGSPNAGRGEVFVFFGATTLSGQKGASTADVTLQGKASNNYLGRSVSSAGDVNGDGIEDMIMGAHGNDDGATDAGAAYIFFGSTTLSGTKSLATTDSPDVTILGKKASDALGNISVSGAGDVNGDGFDDVIVGAHANDDSATPNSGAAYIFFGAGNLSGTKNLGGGQSADVTILGKAASDFLGAGASGAGDVNGDGFDDIIVSGYANDTPFSSGGQVYIFFGASSLSGTKNLATTASADVTFQGKGSGARLGLSVSGAGDVNGDGFDDVISGSYANGAGNTGYTGKAYIFYGSSTLSGTKGAASANVEFIGKTTNDEFGVSVSGAGDINDDGFDDVIIGAHMDDSGGPANRGAAYIFFGASDLSGTKNLATTASADVTILGQAGTDKLGRGVSGAGDVNADGIPDIIVGAPYNDFVATDASGAAYVIFGSTTLSGTKDLLGTFTPDVTMTGRGASDQAGFGVGGGRDSGGR